jgi:hypothetical protein
MESWKILLLSVLLSIFSKLNLNKNSSKEPSGTKEEAIITMGAVDPKKISVGPDEISLFMAEEKKMRLFLPTRKHHLHNNNRQERTFNSTTQQSTQQ